MTAYQSDIIAFLSSPQAFGGVSPVEVIETHGALVFLCGDTALKLKRAVLYDYLDFSTPARRHAILEREIALNQPAAPTIYRDVIPVTRQRDGSLALAGDGVPVDWVLRMHRFDAADELVVIAARGGLDDALADRIGHSLAAYHAAAPLRTRPGAALIGDILSELDRVFSDLAAAPARAVVPAWLRAARAELHRHRALLDARGLGGSVRRGHGDLHIGNLIVLDGRPVPFDALEFDETLGTCDLLYDLGFLLMDFCHRDLRRAACRVLDAWLLDFDGAQDGGLALLPLFLSVRAAIRAMVLLQTDRARATPGRNDAEAADYVAQAAGYLAPPPPVLVALGGFSGSGKSRLARALAPHLGAAPGAVWLSSDVIRKAGTGTPAPLPGSAYTPAARASVYDTARARAGTILAAGHAAILDATFLDPGQRAAARATATAVGVAFAGLWLDAPPDVLRQRIAARRGDPSDAGLAVLARQLAAGTGALDWVRLDAAGNDRDILASALAAIDKATTRPMPTVDR